MLELRNTLRTDCWEAGGRQLPSYITALTASSADSGGRKSSRRELEKNVNRNETKRKKEKKTEREGRARPEKQIKLRGGGRKKGDVRRKSRL